MRTTPVNATQAVKREQQQPQKEDEKQDEKETIPDPEDTIEITATTVPEVEHQPDGQDQFWITVDAAAELLEQHQHIYPPVEYQQLTGHITHLRNERIDRIYWPPSLTFAAALTKAASPEPESGS